MSIPGVNEPVSIEEESFSFVPDPNAPVAKSKYEFDNGIYPGKVVSFVKGISKAGNPQYVVGVLGTGGPAKGIDYKTFMQLTGNGAGITERTLQNVFGIKKNEAGVLSFKPSDVLGKDVGLDLVKDEFNGKVRMKCKNLVKVPAAAQPASDIPSF